MWESVLGVSVAVTRQNAGRSPNGEGGTVPPRAPLWETGGAAGARVAGGNGTKLPASTMLAQAWRASPKWKGDKLDRKAYEVIGVAVAELDALPAPITHRDVDRLVDVCRDAGSRR